MPMGERDGSDLLVAERSIRSARWPAVGPAVIASTRHASDAGSDGQVDADDQREPTITPRGDSDPTPRRAGSAPDRSTLVRMPPYS
jgi:hypothetical protein